MRTTPELIAELDADSARHARVVLVVGFANSFIVIDSSMGNRLQMLDDAVNMGGIPVGLLIGDLSGQVATGPILTLTTRVNPDLHDNWAEQGKLLLEAYMQKVADKAKELERPPPFPKYGGCT
jgi:hypothetical protein